MNRILVLYPSFFKCYEKFSRKVRKIIQNMDEYKVVYPKDDNGFISRFFTENFPDIELTKKVDWLPGDLTHAIVFDDEEVFPKETDILRASNIKLRVIKIAITRVVNIKKETEYQSIKSTDKYEYIGRGSYWGNPYSMYENGDDREEVIRKFKFDFDYEKFPNKEKSQVYKLAGKRLGCFCKPEACHGDVLADFLNAWDDGR